MASTPMTIGYRTVLAGLGVILSVELLIRWMAPYLLVPPLALLGAGRVLQTVGLLWAVVRWEKSLLAIGWAPRQWPEGVLQGALWSLAFGLAAGLGMLLLHLSGSDPLAMVRSPLRGRPGELILFIAVGGIIAPIAEEICFRGILYGFFRRWGVVAALAASTAVFVVLHATHGLPIIQIVGGLVFALAYETTRNLMVPMTIHILGNLAIFALSLPMLR